MSPFPTIGTTMTGKRKILRGFGRTRKSVTHTAVLTSSCGRFSPNCPLLLDLRTASYISCLVIHRNNRAPMPQLVIAPSATTPTSVSAPPPAAFQPSIRILKRPSANSSSPSATPSNDPQQRSLADREAEYQAARDRIFGAQAASPDSKSPVLKLSRGPSSTPPVRNGTPPAARPIRAPRGPEKTSDPSNPALAKGFRNRKPQAPASSQSSS